MEGALSTLSSPWEDLTAGDLPSECCSGMLSKISVSNELCRKIEQEPGSS